jgi:hypothetical protein
MLQNQVREIPEEWVIAERTKKEGMCSWPPGPGAAIARQTLLLPANAAMSFQLDAVILELRELFSETASATHELEGFIGSAPA